ncbi:MAG: hypothetical protein CMP31_02390 [Roseibacillus sp.]|nr:hypothetical protein [Roseibacillus sp.]
MRIFTLISLPSCLLIAGVVLTATATAESEVVSLFDGKTLAGWKIRKGDEKWWKVIDGVVTGGSMTEKVPHNTFLASARSYGNFELQLKIRLVKGEGFMNSGIQVRSQRVPGNHEMSGYQVDAGIGWWGKLYDESRRNRVIAGPVNPAAIAKTARDWEWNDYRILCEGSRIRSWVNGVAAIDYTEKDAKIPRDGLLGFQAHGGGKFVVQFKDIRIRELAPTPGAPTWESLRKGKEKPKTSSAPRNKVEKQTRLTGGAQSPARELASFRLPEGFVAELVAGEEEGVGKPITVQWDAKGRMWTMTAYEYPLDGNENLAAAKEIYAQGGRDKVLVFDNPYEPGPHTPRPFAEGLALPLGILPMKDGTFVQYGEEIRYYRDQDGDGKADGHTVVLEGFGIQDSHLFPHQFTRAPGGWIYLAQGLFNYSKVRRPGGKPFLDGEKQIVFNQTKLARFRPDGSEFQLLTAGPNNIWGLVIARDGETFIQEANDIGMPVVEFEPGTHYRTGSREKLRPYAPVIPMSTRGPQMGGTGLSGLALAEDRNTPFQLGLEGHVFFVVNPITNRIQIVTAKPDSAGHHHYEKQEDFLVAEDKWFRPVAAHFGPDGCLYIVDWYNKIISHNEVPRSHPDRDKTRGRIWRVRHQSQKLMRPPDLTTMPARELAARLDDSNALVARLAWLEFTDRGTGVDAAVLEAVARDNQAPGAQRLGAFWALEATGRLHPDLIISFARHEDAALRYEAVRAAGEANLSESAFLAVAEAAPDDSNYRIRAALGNAVRYHRKASPAMMALAARLGKPPLSGNGRDVYDRNFERYLARWAMETHRDATVVMLDSEAGAKLDIEARLLAIQALEPAQAAPQLLKILPEMNRALHENELALIAGELKLPAVMEGFARLLGDPDRQMPMLQTLRRLDVVLTTDRKLAGAVEAACLDMLRRDPTPANRSLAVDLARRYRLAGLSGEVRDWLTADRTPAELATGLAALREMGTGEMAPFSLYLNHPDHVVARQALMGFAHAHDPTVVNALARQWDHLSGGLRQLTIDGLTSSRTKGERLVQAMIAGDFDGLDGAAIEKLTAVLGADHPSLAKLARGNEGSTWPVLRLTGDPEDRILTGINLRGAFTLECWIQLDPGIDNNDNILGRWGGPDINFFEGRLRVYAGTRERDVIVANRAMKPHTWTHCAITRNKAGRMRIYLDGEIDQAEGKSWGGDMLGLHIGETNMGGGCAARYMELRVWDVERSPEEIRKNYRTSFATGDRPSHLVERISGDNPDAKLAGRAAVQITRDVPELVNPDEAEELATRLARFRGLATRDGDAAKGRILFQALCATCHQVKGEGQQIGPDLSGAGAMGIESLLRNILTPNAQLESGYYRHDIMLTNGTLLSGFLAAEDAHTVTLRQVGADERVISRKTIKAHTTSRRSLMPEGLVEGLGDGQVTNLFAFLKSLK